MLPILDRQISKHHNNMRCWLIDPPGGNFSKRITYREMAHQIFNDKDVRIIKTDVPIDINRPLGGLKPVCKVRYDGRIVRDVPLAVGEYYFSLVIESEASK